MTKKQSKATKQANAQRAAERAAAIRREQESRERRRRTLWVSLAVLTVLVAVVLIAVAVQAARDTTGQVSTPPQGVVDEYALAAGEDDAPVEVVIYEDFMCPFCGQFEAASREELERYVDQGDVQVRYYMISFLDRASNGTEFSTRAVNAVGVVLDTSGPEVAKRFHDLLFENQPEEGTDGLSDEQMIDLAVKAGAERAEISDPIADRKFEPWVENATDQSSKNGITSTPTVLVDGETVEAPTIEEMLQETTQAIDAALAG